MNGERLYKLAFFAPFETKKEDYDTVSGFAAEQGNRAVGSLTGAAGGGGIGAGIGGAIGAILKGKKGAKAGAKIGGIGGAVVGSTVGDVKSLHKSEEDAGKKKTNFGQYLGRNLLNAAVPVPFVGDYLASRKLQNH